jgi:hypothetical protein
MSMGHKPKFSLEVAYTQVFTATIEADTLEEAEKIARTIQLNSEGEIVKSKYDSKIESFDRVGSKIILANDANTDAFNTEPTGEYEHLRSPEQPISYVPNFDDWEQSNK